MNNQLTHEELAEISAMLTPPHRTNFQAAVKIINHLWSITQSHAEEKRLLIMQADSADWEAAELRVENHELRTATKSALQEMYHWDLGDDPHGYRYEYDDHIERLATKLNIILE